MFYDVDVYLFKLFEDLDGKMYFGCIVVIVFLCLEDSDGKQLFVLFSFNFIDVVLVYVFFLDGNEQNSD